MSLKLNSKTSTNNNKQEWCSTNAPCSGPTSPNTYPTLKNTLDKLDTLKELPKLLFLLYCFIVLRRRLSTNVCGSTLRHLAHFLI